MSQLLRYVFAVTVLFGPSLRAEEPRNPAGRTDPLPSGAVSRFGTSRFLNFGRVFSVAIRQLHGSEMPTPPPIVIPSMIATVGLG